MEVTLRNFYSSRDVRDSASQTIALERAWRLREGSLRSGTRDPGRMLRETRNDHRDSVRRAGHQIPYQQVVFYTQSPTLRDALYETQPQWWE